MHILRTLQTLPLFRPSRDIYVLSAVARNRQSTKRPRSAAAGGGGSLEGYPNLSTAASILGVSVSTLSRRHDLAAHRRGERDLVLSPGEVLRLAVVYRKRSLNDVAQALLQLAQSTSADNSREIEAEIESFFEARAGISAGYEEFVDVARRLLPASLVAEIERTLSKQSEELPDLVQGYLPEPSPKRRNR